MSLVQHKDVLIVDDDEAIRTLLRTALLRAGLDCDTAGDGMDALEHLRVAHYRVVLSDLMMPRLDGIGFVRELAALDRTTGTRPVIMIMTAFPDRRDRLPEVAEGVHAIVRKPFDLLELTDLIRACIEARHQTELRERMASRPSSPALHEE